MTIKNYIHGNLESDSKSKINVFDPSTWDIINEVVNSNEVDFSNTINSSVKGFNEWLSYTPLKRSRIISKFKNNIEQNVMTIIGAKIYATKFIQIGNSIFEFNPYE